jgi:hypothetical protein
MIQFACDGCGKSKKAGDAWILGLAAESVGARSSGREVDILSGWTEAQAVHPLAIHFCSQKCKDKYIAELFERTA